MEKTLIISLDKLSKDKAQSIIYTIIENNSEFLDTIIFKVNDLLALIGLEGVAQLFSHPKAFIMLDAKYHDIGNTLCNYLEQIQNSGLANKVKLLTVHSSNGEKALQQLVEKKAELGLNDVKIVGITLLTSLDGNDAVQIYGKNTKETVVNLACIAKKSGLDGVVCSSLEAGILREIYGEDFLLITPGIRFEGDEKGDQIRVTTPKKAIENGSNAIVMGRSILNNGNIQENIEKFFSEIAGIQPLFNSGAHPLTPSLGRRGDNNIIKLLYTENWEALLKYIGVIYLRAENGKYCRLASGLLSNGYLNIAILERYPNILHRGVGELSKQLQEKAIFTADNIDEYIILGTQMGSIRISSHLSHVLGISGASIYTEKGGDDNKEMLLKRHNISLKGKKIIISEDIVNVGSTIVKLQKLVTDLGGEVVAITCIGNRYGQETFLGIPLLSCYTPPEFELFYDEKTPEMAQGEYSPLPEKSGISEKPKNDWDELVESMRE